MKFEVGKKLEPFCCDTICQDGVSAEDLTEGLPTMFLFLRYYGCRICQLDLRDLDLGYEAVRRAGGRVVAVLQSKREILEAAAEEKPFPYTVICDPDQKLYRQFEILPAADRDELKGGDAPKKSARAVEMGLVHGEYEGNELQLPAAVLVDGEMTVRYGGGDCAVDKRMVKKCELSFGKTAPRVWEQTCGAVFSRQRGDSAFA